MIIGVFGGAGSGKSEVLHILRDRYRAYIIEADKVAHTLYRRKQPGYKAVIRICGKEVLDGNKDIDRKKLSEVLFSDPVKLDMVNKAVHPMVGYKIRSLTETFFRNNRRGLVVYEAALLPADFDAYDEVWYVYTPEDIRRRRMKETRGYTDSRIDSILKNQPSEEEYRNVSDRVIVNTGNLSALRDQVDAAMEECMPGRKTTGV